MHPPLPLVQTALVAGLILLGGCVTAPETPPAVPADPDFRHIAWLAGAWEGVDTRGMITEERWSPARAGTMLGVNRTIVADRTVFFEYLRIEHRDDGSLVYLAAPRGRAPATPFTMIETAPGRVVFENPDHDFPQRITYRQEGDRLVMMIEGTENGAEKASSWTLGRIEP